MGILTIHPLTIKRVKQKAGSLFEHANKEALCKEIEFMEDELQGIANHLADEVAAKLTYRSSQKKKLIRNLRKADLDYPYYEFDSDNEEIMRKLIELTDYAKEIKEKKTQLKSRILSDYSLNRANLKKIYIDNKALYNSVYMINPEIYPRLEKYLSEIGEDNVDLRKLELVLIRIATRAVTKTSPISKLNSIAILGNNKKIPYRIHKKQITVNNVFLFYIYEKYMLDNEIIKRTGFIINKNYYLEDNYLNIISQEQSNSKVFKTKDRFLRIPINIYIQNILDCEEDSISFTYLQSQFKLADSDIIQLLKKLYGIGLITINDFFSDTLDAINNLICEMEKYHLPTDSQWIDVIQGFKQANELLERINNEFTHEIQEKIVSVFNRISEMCGIELDNKKYLYEDNLTVEDEILQLKNKQLRDIKNLLEIYALFDINTRIQLDFIDKMEKQYNGDSVPISDMKIFRLISDVNVNHQSYWRAPWDPLESESETSKLLERLKQRFKKYLESYGNQDIIHISNDFVSSLKEEIPQGLKDNQVSYSFFYQKHKNNLVINRVYIGYMSFYSRFLRYTDITNNNRNIIEKAYFNNNYEVAEVYETFGFNANVHESIFKTRIISDYTRDTSLNKHYEKCHKMEDMSLTVKDGNVLLQSGEGELFKPVITSSMIRILFPSYIVFYSSLFTNVSHYNELSCIFFSSLDEKIVNKSPRIYFGSLVLERKRFLIYTEMLKEAMNLDICESYIWIRRFLNHHAIPLTFFFQTRILSYREKIIKSTSQEFEKPQYFDLENILLLKVLINAIRTSEVLMISEVLPESLDACEYMTEFMLN